MDNLAFSGAGGGPLFRRASSASANMFRKQSQSKMEKALQHHEREIDETLLVTSLTHTKQATVAKKDFSQEVRASKDIKNFVEHSEVLLDIPELSWEPIIDRMLDEMAIDRDEPQVRRSDLKSVIFADEGYTRLTEMMQGTVAKDGGDYEWEQTWICCPVTVATLQDRHVAIARLKHSVNLGPQAEEVRFVILILCPSDVKVTKTATETARTFGTVFSDMSLRHNLLNASTSQEFKAHILVTSNEFATHQAKPDVTMVKSGDGDGEEFKWYHVGKGILADLQTRIPYYLDDYKDGLVGKNTLQKTTSTTLFLYFSVILPAVALGVLNSSNTHGAISVQHVIIGQTLGAIVFTLLAGQPLVVVMTTAPLALFIKIIYSISEDFGIEFLPFYAAIGLWNSFFLFVYSFFNMSVLMRYSTRSTEEIFSNFITIAFITDSTKNMVKTFRRHYWADHCKDGYYANSTTTTTDANGNATLSSHPTEYYGDDNYECQPDTCYLSFILMLGTLWLGVTLFDFKKTPFLSRRKREMLSDYALPVSVVVFSLVGTLLFQSTAVKTFPYDAGDVGDIFRLVRFDALSVGAVFGAMGLGFSLSLLFFMDQNISAAMVNSPDNKLVKGNAYHWDLLVVGVINGALCIFGLPFMHAVLPHSPLHVKCLADTEEHVESGYVRNIVVAVRETRLTNLFSNILIGLSTLFLAYVLDYIPTAVLDGLFLYLAVTALYGNQMFERVLLFITEQAAYPPNHYVRRVPEPKMHVFTACQLVQLLILCAFGFNPWPYAKMIFPLVILSFLPVRHLVIPKFVDKKYLDVLDGIGH